ncbi:UDP-N-acetylmuramoyl-tripeptide--D-alanyl-D-alanine ligase [Streptomyces sp. A3M-1-3]|uniref:UDP-N-acetylmuramoyl-tripeptide--D-alanyl-D- alanine ligase n=1 Tax=Streptomyces sp. A3M-1-3 TaxID=2962044 RepID=UPI0020B7BB70|nr:UDP-N-acetylmuramoyl-tripeptide--D-alanyl-D-alanine ligase [Streptomyces sp. A3M-1-3]MCP3822177.1 UDP-N-acetylmuramoyl-tripeptide--D-alanyl-D-alanine ligase [Streptomyces sp. A3M-1-3]
MIPLTLADIAQVTRGQLHNLPDANALVAGPISFDSRDIAADGLFACLKGRTLDGHDFAVQAVANGAKAVLADRPVDAPAIIVSDVLEAMGHIASTVAEEYTGTVIAVTGSAGKTTTKDVLENILALDGPTVANAKSFNNEIGFPVTVSRVMPTSRYLLLEMGARGKGHIASLCQMVRPRIATVLGVGSAHLGEFGSKQAIADAKAEIIHTLPEHGVAVLNTDDPLVAPMVRQTVARVLTFGTTGACDVRADDINVSPDSHPTFALKHIDREAHVTLGHIYGRHNVMNALAAAATAIAAGVPFDRIAQGLETAELSSGGRMEVTRRAHDGVTIINDAFNASPESVLAALEALADIAGPERRRIAVLGEMAELGDEALDWHDKVAHKVVVTGVHRTIGVGGHHAQHMINAIRSSGLDATSAALATGLAGHVNAQLQPGDVVLVKGANALGLESVARELAAMTPPV